MPIPWLEPAVKEVCRVDLVWASRCPVCPLCPSLTREPPPCPSCPLCPSCPGSPPPFSSGTCRVSEAEVPRWWQGGGAQLILLLAALCLGTLLGRRPVAPTGSKDGESPQFRVPPVHRAGGSSGMASAASGGTRGVLGY